MEEDVDEKPRGDGGRGGREGSQAPGPWSPKAGEGRKDPILEPLEGLQPCATLVLGVWSPGLGDDGRLVVRTGRGWIPMVLSQSMRRLC